MKFYAVIGLLLLISCGNDKPSSSNSYSEGKETYEETKLSLEEQERMYPEQFLSLLEPTYRPNVWGEWVLEGQVYNSASIATYKDIRFSIRIYSKTGTELTTTNYVWYEFIQPNSGKNYKLKIPRVSGDKEGSVGYTLSGAE